MSQLIPIGVRTVVSYAIVDDDLYGYLSRFTWSPGSFVTGDPANCYAWNGGLRRHMHALVLECAGIVVPSRMVIDHINGQRNDNQLKNLRVVTTQENILNRLWIRPGIPNKRRK